MLVFTVLGWFDYLSAGTPRLGAALGAEVVAAPWSHMPWGSRAGDIELGPDASPSLAHEALLAFFDRHLQGARSGSSGTDAVRQMLRYLPVFGTWRHADSWPPTMRHEVFHFAGSGRGNNRHGDGRLSPAPEAPGPPEVLVVEPLVPYPGALDPLEDESAAEDRRDVLCFTSEPLAVEVEITGTPLAS